MNDSVSGPARLAAIAIVLTLAFLPGRVAGRQSAGDPRSDAARAATRPFAAVAPAEITVGLPVLAGPRRIPRAALRHAALSLQADTVDRTRRFAEAVPLTMMGSAAGLVIGAFAGANTFYDLTGCCGGGDDPGLLSGLGGAAIGSVLGASIGGLLSRPRDQRPSFLRALGAATAGLLPGLILGYIGGEKLGVGGLIAGYAVGQGVATAALLAAP